MNKSRIMFLAAANNVHTMKWVNALSEKYEIHLVTCKNHSKILNDINENVHIHKLKFAAPLGYYTNAMELKRLYKAIKPQLVNVHFASGYGTLARVAKINPVLLSVWGSDIYIFPNKNKMNKKILYKNLSYANTIASTSENMKTEILKLYPDIDKKIYITPFGVDTNKFKKNENVKKNDNFRIGIVKGLEKNYAVEDLIVAFKKLLEKTNREKFSQKLELYIYGDGSLRTQLEELTSELNIKDKVFFEGRISNDDVPEALSKMDLFCVTSVSESFGVSVLEAMSVGIPVVATDAPGFKEIIENNKTGILVPRRDTDMICNAMYNLMKNEEMRKTLSMNAMKMVKEKFELKNNVNDMISLYEKVKK